MGDMSSSSCSAFRLSSTNDNHIEIKNGTPYSVMTGYKIYADQAAFDAGTVTSNGSGAKQTMTFEAAAAVAAGAALLSAALAF